MIIGRMVSNSCPNAIVDGHGGADSVVTKSGRSFSPAKSRLDSFSHVSDMRMHQL